MAALLEKGQEEVRQSELKAVLQLDKSAISRRVADALDGGFLKNHYNNPAVTDLINKQLTTTDKTARESAIKDAQNALAKDISTLPLLQGAQVAISAKGVNGVDKTLDASFKFRLGTVSK